MAEPDGAPRDAVGRRGRFTSLRAHHVPLRRGEHTLGGSAMAGNSVPSDPRDFHRRRVSSMAQLWPGGRFESGRRDVMILPGGPARDAS